MLELLSIQFAHTPSLESYATALNVRKNGSTEASVPEWIPGRTAGDSRAVYAISGITGRLIKIRVRIRSTDMQQGPVFIRARAYVPSDQIQRGCNAIVGLFLLKKVNPDDINVYILGDVAEQRVNFMRGIADDLEFTVAQRGVDFIATGKTTWTWECRTSSTGTWAPFAQTEHTIYTVLSPPTEPWELSGRDEVTQHHLLWTDLLEHACWWARGQRTLDGAAGAITEQLYERGSSTFNLLRYEHGSGSPAFTDRRSRRFNLQGFLNAIDLSRRTPTDVNCDDCSCALVTFANALGCELWVVPVGSRPSASGGGLDRHIYLNPIRVIGSEWNNVIREQNDAMLGNYFWYHSVAMTGECTFEDNVYDGMLQVNGNTPPFSDARPEPLYVKKFRFGAIGDTDYPDDRVYRYRLAKQNIGTTQSQNYCTPRNDLRYRPVVWWA